MEDQNTSPTEPQNETPSLGAIQAQPMDQAVARSTIPSQNVPPEPLPVQPQTVQTVPLPAPTPLPSHQTSPPS